MVYNQGAPASSTTTPDSLIDAALGAIGETASKGLKLKTEAATHKKAVASNSVHKFKAKHGAAVKAQALSSAKTAAVSLPKLSTDLGKKA